MIVVSRPRHCNAASASAKLRSIPVITYSVRATPARPVSGRELGPSPYVMIFSGMVRPARRWASKHCLASSLLSRSKGATVASSINPIALASTLYVWIAARPRSRSKPFNPIGSWKTPVSGWARTPARNGRGETR